MTHFIQDPNSEDCGPWVYGESCSKEHAETGFTNGSRHTQEQRGETGLTVTKPHIVWCNTIHQTQDTRLYGGLLHVQDHLLQEFLPQNHNPTCQHTTWEERIFTMRNYLGFSAAGYSIVLLLSSVQYVIKTYLWRTAPSGGLNQSSFLQTAPPMGVPPAHLPQWIILTLMGLWMSYTGSVYTLKGSFMSSDTLFNYI